MESKTDHEYSRRLIGGVLLFLICLGVFEIIEGVASVVAPTSEIDPLTGFVFAGVYAVLNAIIGRQLPCWSGR